MGKKLSVFIFILFSLVMVACRSNGDGDINLSEKVELMVSAAASLTDVLNEIQKEFNEKYPDITITYNFGGSGKLASQIQSGAPADIFLSASEVDMDTLEERGLIDSPSRFPFVKNGLVLIAPNESSLHVTNLEQLNGEEVEHFVIGDPDSVPAGRYGKQAFETAGVWDDLDGKFVYASDVRQVLTQVEAGNGDAGIVFLTDAKPSQNCKIVLSIDEGLHDEIIYPAAILSASSKKEAAQKFLNFLKGEESKKIFNDYGFITN